MLYQGLKKHLWFLFPDRPYFFLPTLLLYRATLFSPGGCGLLVQRAKMASVVTIIIVPKIAQQKTAKTVKKIFKKFFISNLPTLIFSRYETGTTGRTVSTLGKSTVNERWHSSHNVDALKTVILCCTNTIVKD